MTAVQELLDRLAAIGAVVKPEGAIALSFALDKSRSLAIWWTILSGRRAKSSRDSTL
jgi:hypothetical protein